MAKDEKYASTLHGGILTPEQEALLNLYVQKLDDHYEMLKATEQIQVEIETEHLKKILSK